MFGIINLKKNNILHVFNNLKYNYRCKLKINSMQFKVTIFYLLTIINGKVSIFINQWM